MPKLECVARSMLRGRNWLREEFGPSSVAADVLLTLGAEPQARMRLTQLYLTVPYSHPAVKNALRLLTEKGLAVEHTSTIDRRVRWASLSDEGKRFLMEWHARQKLP